MNIRVLGCCGGIGDGRRTTSFLINDSVLLDAGSGLTSLSLDEMSQVDHIFLTHAHLDHVQSLPSLLDNLIIHAGKSVVVHALEATAATLQKHVFNNRLWPDFTRLPSKKAPVVRFEIHEHGDRIEVKGLKVELIRVRHRGPATGYLFEAEGGSFAFSGDTTTNDSFWERLNSVDRLSAVIVEAAFPESAVEFARASMHYCPSLLAADLEKLEKDPGIYLSHLKPGFEKLIIEECRSRVSARKLARLWQGDFLRIANGVSALG